MWMSTHQASRRSPCLCSYCSRLGPGFGLTPKPALGLTRPDLFLDPCLRSRPDPGLGLCLLPSLARDLCPGPSSKLVPVRRGLCPCLESMSGLDWSVLLGLCQSSRPAPAVALCPGPRRRGLCPCWSSSSGPEAGTALCRPLGLEATHPLPPVSEEALQRVEPWILGLPHWPGRPMTSLSSWWLGNLLFLWKHSGGPHT